MSTALQSHRKTWQARALHAHLNYVANRIQDYLDKRGVKGRITGGKYRMDSSLVWCIFNAYPPTTYSMVKAQEMWLCAALGMDVTVGWCDDEGGYIVIQVAL